MLRLEKQVAQVIREYHLFKANDRILIGVSGGPDSVALLSLIFKIHQVNSSCPNIFVAHLDHSIRGKESEEDKEFVNRLAKRFRLPLFTEKKRVGDIARKRKISLEEAAREERYKFFVGVAAHVGADVVAVGHNADDNVETILHRIIRGTGIVGLSGIRPKRKLTPFSTIHLVRPLLFTWRKDIIGYLEEENLSYRIDSTNFERDKFRNKIREELIPYLEKDYNAKIKKSLVTLGKTAAQNSDFLETKAKVLFEDSLLNEEAKTVTHTYVGEIVLDRNKLAKEPVILQQVVIKEAITRLNIPLKKFSYDNYISVLDIFQYQQETINTVIKKDLNVMVRGNQLHLSRNKFCVNEHPVIKQTVVTIPGETILDGINGRIKTQIIDKEDGFLEEFKRNKTRCDEAVDYYKIHFPLIVRQRKPGDRFWPLGSPGIKKVKDFFIDHKVPVHERDATPVVTMNDQPVWIVGFRIDDRIRITANTRKLLIMEFENIT